MNWVAPTSDRSRTSPESARWHRSSVWAWQRIGASSPLSRPSSGLGSAGVAGLAGDLCVDGAIGSHTASLREPYADAETCGARYLSEQQIADHVIACTRAGLQAGFHCIGDDAVAAAVSGLRRAASVLGVRRIRAARHRLEHVEMISEADIATLAEFGVVASMQPAFDAAWGKPGELYEQRLGSSRAPAMNRFGTLERSGVRLAFGTDAPVTPLAGWATVQAAVQHWQPRERLSVTSAFDAATRGAHWAAFADNAGTDTGRALWPDLRYGTSQQAVWNGRATTACGYAMVCSRPVRRRSPPASSSIDPSRLSEIAPPPC